jgi:ferritin
MQNERRKQKRKIMPKSIPPKVLSELQRQLNQELNAASGYLAMSVWCAVQNLKGFARFFAKQADEERKHAGKIIDHLVNRGVPPVLAPLPAPRQDFPELLDLVLQAQAMEQANTKGIDTVFAAALADNDYPAQVLMHWFINEQVEEEAWAAELAGRVKSATCAGSLSDLDRHVEKLLANGGEKED